MTTVLRGDEYRPAVLLGGAGDRRRLEAAELGRLAFGTLVTGLIPQRVRRQLQDLGRVAPARRDRQVELRRTGFAAFHQGLADAVVPQ
jgi:hypothetical protein